MLRFRHGFLRVGVPLLLGGAACLAYWIEPGQTPWLPGCLFHWATGLYCPGCGNTRALHALVHGRVGEAIDFNVLLLPTLVYLLVLSCWPQVARKQGLNWGIVWAVGLFFLLRNLPWEPFVWLAP